LEKNKIEILGDIINETCGVVLQISAEQYYKAVIKTLIPYDKGGVGERISCFNRLLEYHVKNRTYTEKQKKLLHKLVKNIRWVKAYPDEIPIEVLDIPTRINNILFRTGIESIEELENSYNCNQLTDIRNLGVKSITQIGEALDDFHTMYSNEQIDVYKNILVTHKIFFKSC
jgi:hypothetical protein